jgi:hypothetical protein
MVTESNTPSRIHFQRAGAVRRRLSSPATPTIQGAHAHLVERLAAQPPNVISPFLAADEDDLELRADHLRIVLRATADYVSALVHDTADNSWAVQTDRKHLDGLFDDIIGDYVGAIEQAAETVREERGEHAA